MKFRYLPFLAVGVIAIGCGSKAGTDSSSTDTTSSTTTSSTTGGSTAATTGTTGTTGSTTSTTGTTGTSGSTTGTTTGTTTGSTTGTTGAGATTPGKPGGATAMAPGNPPQMTPEQQKQFQAQMAKMQAEQKKKMAENGAQAEKAVKGPIEGVSGKYKIQFDMSKVPAQAQQSPQFKALMEATMDFKSDGSFVLSGMGPQSISGYSGKLSGKPVLIMTLPSEAVKKGLPAKQLVNITVADGGSTINLPNNIAFKKQ